MQPPWLYDDTWGSPDLWRSEKLQRRMRWKVGLPPALGKHGRVQPHHCRASKSSQSTLPLGSSVTWPVRGTGNAAFMGPGHVRFWLKKNQLICQEHSQPVSHVCGNDQIRKNNKKITKNHGAVDQGTQTGNGPKFRPYLCGPTAPLLSSSSLLNRIFSQGCLHNTGEYNRTSTDTTCKCTMLQ